MYKVFMRYSSSIKFLFSKSIIYSICALLGIASSTAYAEDDALVQQILVYSDTATYQYLYWYKDGLKTMELKRLQTESGWDNLARTEWFYQSELCISQLQEEWSGNEWEKVKETRYTYKEGLQVTYTENNYAKNNSYTVKTEYTYNNNLLTTETHYIEKNSLWANDYVMSYHYNSLQLPDTLCIKTFDETLYIAYSYTSDSLPLQQVMMLQTDSGLQKQYRYTFFYDNNTRLLTSQKIQHWEATDAGYNWVNLQNMLYTYNDAGLLINEIYQYWNVMFWENDMRYGYTYLANNLPETKTTYSPLYRKWRDMTVLNYEYENSPRKETVTSQYNFWGGETDAPYQTQLPYIFNALDNVESKSGNKVEILYTKPEDTATMNNLQHSSIFVYPNPSPGIYYIDTQLHNIKSWQIYSLNGSFVTGHANTIRTGMIDISDCLDGMYMLRVITDQGTYYQKLVKQK